MGSAKLATIDDMPKLIRMARSFFDVSGYSRIAEFKKDTVESVLTKLIGEGYLITTDGGMLGFVIFPCFFDDTSLLMQELFWWVDEDSRGKGAAVEMLKLAESIAKDKNCRASIMINIDELDGDRVSKLYSKLGYNKSENNFMKVLSWQ